MPNAEAAVPLRFDAGGHGDVSALQLLPEDAALLYVLAHGAGAGMRHPFLEAMAQALAAVGIGTLRYQFPSMEAGRRRPDLPHVAVATVRAAGSCQRHLRCLKPARRSARLNGSRTASSRRSARSG